MKQTKTNSKSNKNSGSWTNSAYEKPRITYSRTNIPEQKTNKNLVVNNTGLKSPVIKSVVNTNKSVNKNFLSNKESEQLRLAKLEEKLKKEKIKRKKLAAKQKQLNEKPWYQHVLEFGSQLIPHMLPMVLGMGDYADAPTGPIPEVNSLLAAVSRGKQGYQVPFMHETGEKVRITHREYLGDVYSSTSIFDVQTFSVNPGIQTTFPWLASIASQFTSYRILGLNAEFISEGSDYANAAGLGYVAMAAQYNVLEVPFTTKRELLNYQFANSAKPSRDFCLWFECKNSVVPQERLYVRNGDVSEGDLRLYDLCKLFLAVGGNTQNNVVLGELWLTYDIEFSLPRLSDVIGSGLLYASSLNLTVTNPEPFGTEHSLSPSSTFEINFTATTMTFPQNLHGTFLVAFVWTDTDMHTVGVTLPNFTINSPNSIQLLKVMGENAVDTLEVGGIYKIVLVGGDQAVITASTGGTFVQTSSQCVAYVSQIPADAEYSKIFDPLGKHQSNNFAEVLKHCKKTDAPVVEYAPISEIGSFTLYEGPQHMKFFAKKDSDNKKRQLTDEQYQMITEMKEKAAASLLEAWAQ